MDDDLKRRERLAARKIADRAKANANFSRRIPLATKVAEYGDHVEVQVSGRKAPNAAAFEKPQQHPLFGDYNHMYQQPHRPFLQEALDSEGDRAAGIIGDVVDDWAEEEGFHEG